MVTCSDNIATCCMVHVIQCLIQYMVYDSLSYSLLAICFTYYIAPYKQAPNLGVVPSTSDDFFVAAVNLQRFACVGTQAVPTGVNSHERLSESTRCNTWGFSFCPWPTAKRFVGDFPHKGNGSCRGGQFFSPKGRTVELTLRELK